MIAICGHSNDNYKLPLLHPLFMSLFSSTSVSRMRRKNKKKERTISLLYAEYFLECSHFQSNKKSRNKQSYRFFNLIQIIYLIDDGRIIP
jgi:hypothetical protein